LLSEREGTCGEVAFEGAMVMLIHVGLVDQVGELIRLLQQFALQVLKVRKMLGFVIGSGGN
jgi:hypothetical protein